ncbi:MAG TPA: hypothetical protein GXX51_11540 [Firmicutes bacterium]|nr:hypothetical protein [Bacillota bacterium]
MLIKTTRTLALRCPSCGRLDYHVFSLFYFTHNRVLKVSCPCGETKAVISTKDYRRYFFNIPCIVCETSHVITLDGLRFCQDDLTTLVCPETALELGYLGRTKKIKSAIRSYQYDVESLINDLGFEDYFKAPEVMLETLKHLHKIASSGNLYCQCGNYNIEVDIYPEKLELHCPRCDSINIIYAETKDDLDVVRKVKSIELTKGGFNRIDTGKFGARKTHKKS